MSTWVATFTDAWYFGNAKQVSLILHGLSVSLIWDCFEAGFAIFSYQ
jgi:hypothetical protein